MKDFSPVIAAFVAFAATALLGYIIIPYLRKLKFGQTILDIGPKWHKQKQGTPTMGGIMMISGVIIALALALSFSLIFNGTFFNDLKNPLRLSVFIAGLIMALCMALVGFIDDYIKVVKKRNLGLTARQKTFMQLIISAAYLATLALSGLHTTYIPFLGHISVVSGIGLIFWPVALIFIYGFTNAVNLTDGVDGLASSVTLVVGCAFMLAAGLMNNNSINVLGAALAGSCAGFLLWNSNPAKVFMGDTGSMFLGGMVVALSFGIGAPILLLLAGIVYFMEAVSVMLQVAYYKKTKKRLFKMTPIHHHFEMSGWKEDKIVAVFSIITFVGCFIALLPILFNR